jgi:outer membrane receptor protein involved in Fe transport
LKSLLLSLLIFVSFTAFNQECLVTGVVVDPKNEVIPGASIYTKSNKTTCDFDGKFSLAVNCLPKQTIYFSSAEYGIDSIIVDVNNSSNLKLAFKQIETEIEEVTISVGKFDKPLEEQTVSLEIIRPELIANKNTRSIESALDQTPGLNILDGEPQIRGGSGFTFGVGSKVAVLVDDVPMLSGDAGRPEWGFIPVENIHQVEVIKGAASVLSGASALSGSINIRTAYPTSKKVLRFTTYAGLYSKTKEENSIWYNDLPAIAGASFIFTEKRKNWDFVLGGNGNYDHGYIGPPITDTFVVADTISNFTQRQMQSKRIRLNFSLSRKLLKSKNLLVGLNGNGMIAQTNMVFAWLDDTAGLFRAYPGAVFLQNQSIFNLDPYAVYFGKKAKHSLHTRYLRTINDMSANQNNEATVFYADYQQKREIKKLKQTDLIGGLTVQYTDSYANIFSGSGSPYNTIANVSAYLQAEKKFKERLNVSTGFRIEGFRLNDTIDALKPIFRTGISYHLGKATFIRSSFGQGYRFPTITERFIKTGVGNFGVFPNPDLKPETSWNAEIGIKQGLKLGPVLGFFDIAGFWQEYQNTIEYMFGIWDAASPTSFAGFKFLNTGNSRVLGIDCSFSGKADFSKSSKLIFMLGYNYILPKTLNPDYIYSTDDLGREFSYTKTSLNPDSKILKYRFIHQVKMDIEWSYKSFQLGLSMKYFSKIENMDLIVKDFEETTQDLPFIQDVEYMDFYDSHRFGNTIFDMRFAYKISDKHKIALIGANILNRTYSLRPLKIESPRTIMLQYVMDLSEK